MREDYRLARLYMAQSLSQDARMELPRELAHYLTTVLRKREGNAVRLFNGEDGEWRALISEAVKKSVTLTIETQLRTPAAMPDVWLLFAPVKKARTEFILEKATELGAVHIQPVITARTQHPRLRMDRVRAQIIEAAEQTERLDIPQSFEPVKFMDALSDWNPERALIFADEGLAGEPAHCAKTVLSELSGSNSNFNSNFNSGPCAILIGPEGGFDSNERSYLHSLPFVRPVSLGPRILRADTAAVSLLTLWQAHCGD